MFGYLDHPDNNFSSLEKKLALGLFLLLWVFLFAKAIMMPMVHDELATFFHYIQSDNYMPPKAHWDACNHVLNSMLSNWSYHLFGQSPLALRLPNVLSFLFLFFGSFGIASRIKSVIIRWGLLTSFVMSAYVLEYLAECRGYGMSMALMVTSIYYLMRLIETSRLKYLYLCGLFLFLAASANLTLMITVVLIFSIIGLNALFIYKNKWKELFIRFGHVLIAGLPFLLLVKLSFTFRELGAFYYGSLDGFRIVTVPTLSTVILGTYNVYIGFALTFIAFLIIFGFGFIGWKIKKDKETSMFRLVFPFLFIGAIILIKILAKFMDVNYPEDRAGMYLYFFMAGGIAFTLDALFTKYKSIAFGGILLFFIPFQFFYHLNPATVIFSPEERHSQIIFDYVASQPNSEIFPATIGGYQTQQLCWYYMNNCAGGNQGRLHYSNYPGLDADYQLISKPLPQDSKIPVFYDSLLTDPYTGVKLYERKKKLPRNLIQETSVTDTDNNTVDYYNFAVYAVDSLIGKTLYLGIDAQLTATDTPFRAWISVGISDQEGNTLIHEFVSLEWLRRNWSNEENRLRQGTLIHEVPEDAYEMKFYLWNIEQKPFSIRDGKCYLYVLERDY